jgi:hypothetical protein
MWLEVGPQVGPDEDDGDDDDDDESRTMTTTTMICCIQDIGFCSMPRRNKSCQRTAAGMWLEVGPQVGLPILEVGPEVEDEDDDDDDDDDDMLHSGHWIVLDAAPQQVVSTDGGWDVVGGWTSGRSTESLNSTHETHTNP